MTILAIDTCFDRCAVHVSAGGRDVSHAHSMTRGHAEALMPMIVAALAEAHCTFAALDRIAVTTGPGTFTGIRVGVAAARGLGIATAAEVIGLSTLRVFAAMAAEANARESVILAVIPAPRAQVYAQFFEADDGGLRTLCTEALVDPGDLESCLPDVWQRGKRPLAVAGPAAALVGDRLGFSRDDCISESRLIQPMTYPDLATAARHALCLEPAKHQPRPIYLRPADATPLSPDKIVSRI